MKRTFLNLFGLALTWFVWLWIISHPTAAYDFTIALIGALFVVPVVLAGRWLLDRQPDVQRAEEVTIFVHYLIGIFWGSALVCAVRCGLNAPAWPIPLPSWIGIVLLIPAGIVLLLVIFNLALKGLGAPFAVSLTRRVVTEWLYAWTRNPMILSALAFLVGLGLWIRSGLFLAWLLVVAGPAILMFAKFYEERELEIRFGKTYLDYRAQTPMFFPRFPKKSV